MGAKRKAGDLGISATTNLQAGKRSIPIRSFASILSEVNPLTIDERISRPAGHRGKRNLTPHAGTARI
jgi:hypothetical protein